MKNVRQDFTLRTIEDGTSDHNPIEFILGTGPYNEKLQTRDYTDWKKFSNNLKLRITKIPQNDTPWRIQITTKQMP